MQSIFKPLLVGTLLATSAMLAQAQTAPAAPTGMQQPERMQQRMQERMASRLAALKTRLGLSAAQEGAWNTYLAAMQPPASGMMAGNRADRRKMAEEWRAMTTPQRLDRMATLKTERDAQMNRRAQATRDFYATLSPEQQKVFDASTMMGAQPGRRGGGWGHRGRG